MSAHSHVTIFCDAPSCGWWNDAGIADTAKAARRQLAAMNYGWKLGVPADGDGHRLRDYCPTHAAGVTSDGAFKDEVVTFTGWGGAS